ncbi:hypothetical protein NE619_02925 [Anaerovorax odorimutans]|uniref:Uncharacterized protein n=1 Tax=Anaerovorax odorimutans TaxID=109327 RepID=A0ABT1RKH2_9FIRM|nr:hypothetical protein [Anaerovorax odorimutans]MCQ4635670.1 hypothetical protein [Anaerovorax odorimutans]
MKKGPLLPLFLYERSGNNLTRYHTKARKGLFLAGYDPEARPQQGEKGTGLGLRPRCFFMDNGRRICQGKQHLVANPLPFCSQLQLADRKPAAPEAPGPGSTNFQFQRLQAPSSPQLYVIGQQFEETVTQPNPQLYAARPQQAEKVTSAPGPQARLKRKKERRKDFSHALRVPAGRGTAKGAAAVSCL